MVWICGLTLVLRWLVGSSCVGLLGRLSLPDGLIGRETVFVPMLWSARVVCVFHTMCKVAWVGGYMRSNCKGGHDDTT